MPTHTNKSKLYAIIDKSARTFQAPDMLPFELLYRRRDVCIDLNTFEDFIVDKHLDT